MTVYRCPKCGQIVMKNAKRCINCGLIFDSKHEPEPDEEDGNATKLSKKEKRKLIIFVAAAVILILALFVFSYLSQRTSWAIEGLL